LFQSAERIVILYKCNFMVLFMSQFKKFLNISILLLLFGFEPNLFSQNFQNKGQVSPMLFPHSIQYKSKYYIITQGVSSRFRKQFNLNDSDFKNQPIVIYEFNPQGAIIKRLYETEVIRSFFGACVVAGKIYIAGGYDENWKPTKTMFEFDLESKKWIDKNDMFIARTNFALENVEGKIYAISGENTKGSVEVYKPANDLWELFDVKYIPAQLKPLENVTASAVIEDKVYLLGNSGSTFQIFSPKQDLLSEASTSPVKSDYFDILISNKKLYIAGGLLKTGIDDGVYMYDAVEGIWSFVGRIPFPRFGSGLATFGNMIIYIGGSVTDFTKGIEPNNEIYLYRPTK
jgi:hypothetical protein